MLEHLWIPVIVIGTAGTAGMIRRLRANLLDELEKQYVLTGKAKGLPPFKLLTKYPLRVALNFFIADIGSLLPSVISGAEIVAIVLSLPTTGPMLLSALQSQDMYLAGTFLIFLAMLTVAGMLISDLTFGVARSAYPSARRNHAMNERHHDNSEHYVSAADFDPYSVEKLTPDQERYFFASQPPVNVVEIKTT